MNKDLVHLEADHPQDTRKQALYESFTGPRASYYILAWDALKVRRMSWNWSAFLFGDAWLFYRKMYLYGALYSLLRILSAPLVSAPSLIESSFNLDLMTLLAPHTLVMNLLLGLFGNHLYQGHADKKIRSAVTHFGEHNLSLRLQSIGGVSIVALLLIPLITLMEEIFPFLLDSNLSYQWTQTYQSF